jgi:hypothetical protein
MRLGYPVAEELRELAVALRKLGINASECALGARVATMMKSLAVDEQDFPTFMSNTYKHLKEMGLEPEKVARNLKPILELSESVLLSDIPSYVEQKVAEKHMLEKEIQKLKSEELAAKMRVQKTILEERITLHDLNEYSNFNRELEKHEISMNDTAKVLEVLDDIKRHGLNPAALVSQYNNLLGADAGKILIDELRKEANELQQEVDSWQRLADVGRLAISKYEELESMGFGLKELKKLCHTVREIAEANKRSPHDAIQKFFADVENQYDEKLGFESRLENLRSEIQQSELTKARTSVANSQSLSFYEMMGLMATKIIEAQQGRVYVGDNFQANHRAEPPPEQQAETQGPNVFSPNTEFNTLDNHETTANINGGTPSTSNPANKNFDQEALRAAADTEDRGKVSRNKNDNKINLDEIRDIMSSALKKSGFRQERNETDRSF